MSNIKKYIQKRRDVSLDSVSYGFMSIELIPPDKLDEMQVGYSINSEGESLTSDEEGYWKGNWYVIAKEDMCGDPIFIDSTNEKFSVYTASSGEGEWDPILIAESFDQFTESMAVIDGISKDRKNPSELEANPLLQKEREVVLEKIFKINNNAIDLDFWENWLEDD